MNLHSSCSPSRKHFNMKRLLAMITLTVCLAACGNNSNNNSGAADGSTSPANDAAGGTTPSITSGNTASRQGQEIPTDSVETSKDSTGNIHPGDTTKK